MKPLTLKAIAALCAAGSVLSISAVAVAQDGPPGSPGRPGPGGAHGGLHGDRDGPGRGFRHGDPAKRAQRLHDLLQITPAQEPAFLAWQGSMKPPARPDRMPERPKTTPERLDRELAFITERQIAVKTRVDATKRFYAQLTPTQRTAMDTLPMMGPGGRHGHGGSEGRGFGRHRGGPGGRGHGPGDGFKPEGAPPAGK